METGSFTVEVSLEQYEVFMKYHESKKLIPVTAGPLGFEFVVEKMETRFYHGVHSHKVKLRQINRIKPDGHINFGWINESDSLAGG